MTEWDIIWGLVGAIGGLAATGLIVGLAEVPVINRFATTVFNGIVQLITRKKD